MLFSSCQSGLADGTCDYIGDAYIHRTLVNGLSLLPLSFLKQVACGKQAGAYACLLDETGRYGSPDFADLVYKPDFEVSSLTEVQSLLEIHFDLRP